ncbi:hypothetical protein E3O25_03430 [Cryobacterium sp. TMT1-3]|nr:hypothetical protein E3O25_03430 [Cryobacterium sp. TMT1-3]
MSALPEVPATTPSSSPPTSRRFAVSAPRVFYPALGIILALVMIGVCVAIYKAFRIEHEVLVVAERRQRREEMARRIGKTVTVSRSTDISKRR